MKLHRLLPYLLSLILCWLFWSTAVSTSISRIASLQTIEAYAFAVHEQLMYNYSQDGAFSQTIHAGYDDKWDNYLDYLFDQTERFGDDIDDYYIED